MSQLYVDGPAYLYVGTARSDSGYDNLLDVPRVYFTGIGGRGGFGLVTGTDGITGGITSVAILDGGSGFLSGSAVAVGSGKGGVADVTLGANGVVTGVGAMSASENYSRSPTTSFAFEFLGFAERGVDVHVSSQADEGLGTDAGHGVPCEAFYLGASAVVSCVLKRFNYAVFERAIAPSPKARTFAFGRGAWSAEYGASLKDDGLTFPLVIWCPRVAQKSDSYGSAAGGMHFVHAYVPNVSETFGVRGKRVPITFRCLPHVDERANMGLLYTPGAPASILPNPN